VNAMTDESFIPPREAAERRVRERFARQSTALVKWQQAEGREAVRDQKRELDSLAEKETALKEHRRQALERLDRDWQQDRDKLGNKPAQAPSFDLGGAVPARNLLDEYNGIREHYERRREQLREGFDERLDEVRRERVEKHHEFETANQVRDRIYLDARIDLADRQNKGFERCVREEIERGEKSLSREFKERSRAPGREL
jgi:hypothetical protein